jgi:hypothetical protein
MCQTADKVSACTVSSFRVLGSTVDLKNVLLVFKSFEFTIFTIVVVIVVSICVSWSIDCVTGILANSVCWWNHPLGTRQLMELAVAPFTTHR